MCEADTQCPGASSPEATAAATPTTESVHVANANANANAPSTAATDNAKAIPSATPAPTLNRLGTGDVVVVAGGGIAGLALAAAIQSQPATSRPQVVVLERDPCSAARRYGHVTNLTPGSDTKTQRRHQLMTASTVQVTRPKTLVWRMDNTTG